MSYRTRDPLHIIGKVADLTNHTTAQLKTKRDRLEYFKKLDGDTHVLTPRKAGPFKRTRFADAPAIVYAHVRLNSIVAVKWGLTKPTLADGSSCSGTARA